jgi:elongation factor Ts
MVAAAVEVNSETDFVARNETFQGAVAEIAGLAVKADSVDGLLASSMASGKSVADGLTNLIATIGENMSVRRTATLAVDPGVVSAYVHNAAADQYGQDRRAGRAEVRRRQGGSRRAGP